MKSFARKCVLGFLVVLARVRLRRLRLFVIGVTGSIGKTSTKDAIYTVLRSRYRVYRSGKSFNTDLGLPLAILEQPSGFSSPLKWIRVMFGAVWSAFIGGRHLQQLVVEIGVDKPGDMAQLLKLVKPQVGVLTNIRPVHMGEGQFKDLDDIFAEKSRLLRSLPERGIAVLNADDPYCLMLRDELVCKKIFYGFSELADVRVRDARTTDNGLEFIVTHKEEVVTGTLPLLGGFQIYVILPAIAVGVSQGFSLADSVDALKSYQLPPGRMNPIPGINESLIIDSTYNASPEAMREALNVLRDIEGRRIAVIGNMNELGEHTAAAHREIGRHAVGKADVLISVGEYAKLTGDAAIAAGFEAEAVRHFEDATSAAEFLRTIIGKGDTLLVKGSQNRVRLERLVKMLMRDPEKAQELLVRQEPEWDKIS